MSSGPFIQALDSFVTFAKSSFLIAVVIIIYPVITVFNFCSSLFLDTITPNVITIKELNPLLIENPKIIGIETLPDNPFAYAKVQTFKQAEKWLRDHGYKLRPIYTKTFDWQPDVEDHVKTFAYKGEPGSEHESVIYFHFETGNGDFKLLPFRYHEKYNPVKYFNLEKTELPHKWWRADTGYGCGTYFQHNIISTHDYSRNWFLYICGLEKWPTGAWTIPESDVKKHEGYTKQCDWCLMQQSRGIKKSPEDSPYLMLY